MKHLIPLALLLLALPLASACVDDEPEASEPDLAVPALLPPEGLLVPRAEPNVLYLSQFAGLHLSDFAELAAKCASEGPDLPVAITQTDYPSWPVGSIVRVLGFGFAVEAPESLITCFKDPMVNLGAQPPGK